MYQVSNCLYCTVIMVNTCKHVRAVDVSPKTVMTYAVLITYSRVRKYPTGARARIRKVLKVVVF